MPMWRCPHCGSPQHEASRCWVCHRSSTTCSTCRHFRQSLAASVGYCGLDRRRAPLSGAEHRGCWQPGSVGATRAVPAEPAEIIPAAVLRLRSAPRPGILEGFVPVELATRSQPVLGPLDLAEPGAAPPTPAPPIVDPQVSWSERDSLFGDAER
jgi:hypothetical protein